MRRPPFLVPRLLWDLSLAPRPTVATTAAPWLGGVISDEEGLRQVLLTLDCLVLGLNVAGYEVDGISLAMRSGGFAQDPRDWLFLSDLVTMQFVVEPRGWAETQPLSVPAGSEAVVALALQPRRMFWGRDPSYARPMSTTAVGFGFEQISAPDGAPPRDADALWDHALDAVDNGGELRVLQIALQRPAPPSSEDPGRFLTSLLSALDDSVRFVTGLVAFDILQGAAAWMEFPLEEQPHGLLGVYNHHQWTFAGERWSAPAEVETMRAVGRDMWALVFPDAAGLSAFLDAELSATHQLGDLIPLARGRRGPFSREFESAAEARQREVYGTAADLKHKLSGVSYIRALMLAHTLGVVDVLGTVGIGAFSGAFDATPANRVEFDATGWYETRLPDPQRTVPSLDPDRDADIQLVQLNQAGAVLTGYWQTRSTDPATGLTAVTVHRLKARAATRPDARIVVTIGATQFEAIRHEYTFDRTPAGSTGPAVTGRLVIEEIYKDPADLGAGDDPVHEVGMTIVYDDPADDPHGGFPVRYVRTSPKPHLSMEAIDSLGNQDRPRVEALQRRALHTAELDAWTAAVDDLIDHVRTYMLLNAAVMKQTEAREADRDLRAAAARHVELAANGTIVRDNGQFLVLRDLARRQLAEQAIAIGLDTRTAFAWANEMVLSQQNVTAGINTLLDLEPTMLAAGGPRPWTYRWKAAFAGVEIDIPVLPVDPGKFGGNFDISKIERASQQVIWTKRYTPSAHLVSAGLSLGVIFEMDTGGDLDWHIDWSFTNFEGSFDIVGVAAGLTPGSGGSYSPIAKITFWGDMTHTPPMSGNATGLTHQLGLHGGVGGALLKGSLSLQVPGAPPALTQGEIEAHLGRSVEVEDLLDSELPFFAVGGAALTSDGWLALAEVCADHRAALETPWTPLKLTGHASTTAGDTVNLPLSANRAANTYDAVRALLGPAFAVAEAGTFIGHRGEYDALLEIPDNTEDPAWRRVDLWFHASMLVRL